MTRNDLIRALTEHGHKVIDSSSSTFTVMEHWTRRTPAGDVESGSTKVTIPAHRNGVYAWLGY